MQYYFGNKNGSSVEFSSKDWHHIKNVMRMRNGSNVVAVVDGKKYLCSVDIDLDEISIIEEMDSSSELGIQLTIAQGLIREQKLDIVLKMCTELGIYEYIPLVMERSVVKLDKSLYSKKVNRWQLICKESAEQSHRDYAPIINDILNLTDIINMDYDLKIVCSTAENLTNIKNVLQNSKKCAKMLMVVGPEGGISPSEEQLLIENGFIPVSLGNRILRTETAPIYISSIINYDFME